MPPPDISSIYEVKQVLKTSQTIHHTLPSGVPETLTSQTGMWGVAPYTVELVDCQTNHGQITKHINCFLEYSLVSNQIPKCYK